MQCLVAKFSGDGQTQLRKWKTGPKISAFPLHASEEGRAGPGDFSHRQVNSAAGASTALAASDTVTRISGLTSDLDYWAVNDKKPEDRQHPGRNQQLESRAVTVTGTVTLGNDHHDRHASASDGTTVTVTVGPLHPSRLAGDAAGPGSQLT